MRSFCQEGLPWIDPRYGPQAFNVPYTAYRLPDHSGVATQIDPPEPTVEGRCDRDLYSILLLTDESSALPFF